MQIKMLHSAKIRCTWCKEKVLYIDYLAVHGPLLCYLRSDIIKKEGKKETKHE